MQEMCPPALPAPWTARHLTLPALGGWRGGGRELATQTLEAGEKQQQALRTLIVANSFNTPHWSQESTSSKQQPRIGRHCLRQQSPVSQDCSQLGPPANAFAAAQAPSVPGSQRTDVPIKKRSVESAGLRAGRLCLPPGTATIPVSLGFRQLRRSLHTRLRVILPCWSLSSCSPAGVTFAACSATFTQYACHGQYTCKGPVSIGGSLPGALAGCELGRYCLTHYRA